MSNLESGSVGVLHALGKTMLWALDRYVHVG